MALELSNKSWRLTFGDGAKRREVSVPAADLAKLSEAVAKAKERFKMATSARVMSKDAAQLRLETLTLWDGRSLPRGVALRAGTRGRAPCAGGAPDRRA